MKVHVRLGLVGGALEIHRGRKQALIIREISRKPAHLIFIRQGVVLIKHWLLLLLLLLWWLLEQLQAFLQQLLLLLIHLLFFLAFPLDLFDPCRDTAGRVLTQLCLESCERFPDCAAAGIPAAFRLQTACFPPSQKKPIGGRG